MHKNLHFKFAQKSDAELVLQFIQELAEFEKLRHEVVATVEDIQRTLFGPRAYAEVLFAYIEDEPAGFALFFHNYSTFLGKPGIYIEDLYVKPSFRGQGIGQAFLKQISSLALERDCGRVEWWVLDWNQEAIKFYQKIGAIPMDEWTVFRLTGEALKKLAHSS